MALGRSLLLLKPRMRHIHAHLVTMPQSGTHWLCYMLALGLSRTFDVPAPAHIGDRRFVLRPQDRVIHPELPRLVHSHNIPHKLVHSELVLDWLRFPRYVLLLRDLRETIVSQYEKKRQLPGFDITFSDYLRERMPLGHPFRITVSRRFAFLNAWTRDIKRLGHGRLLLLRYEELRQSPRQTLQRLWQFLDFPDLEAAAFEQIVAEASKDRMALHERPDAVARVVRQTSRNAFDWYTPADREYLTARCQTGLTNWLGYNYADWRLPPTAERRVA
ncbi:Sulfotransferase domain protein [Maioricimonas rarisocia]|uniref:Sulfotransferase domain protein n=1 Tax=Maioricimonas rarisocia TaxID=2528026 RepID=A0A517Z4A5_9PLAN|nr:sulfotransferase domain-containing protein [Maioricimonas rarisocia]QDU37257.1 Sulfotransferase domain protein [Maioricimonas rarisocia]